MKLEAKGKHILIIERQDYWREFSANALKAAGFSVQTLESYNFFFFDNYVQAKVPDLVIFGCANIEPEDQEMIGHVLSFGCHLLVLSSSPSLTVIHSLFRAGADDVADKPYDSTHLIEIVEQTLKSILPRDSYEAVVQQGVA